MVTAVSCPRHTLFDKGYLGAAYLARHVGTKGRFRYLLDPHTGDTLKGYNLLRHAGALLALARWARNADATTMTDAIGRATEYLLGKVRCPPGSPFPCLASKGRAKLGGTALLILALLETSRLPGQPDRVALCRALGDHLISQQDETGAFRSVLALEGSGRPGFNSSYYPGQAVLALAELHAAVGGERFLTAALRGAGSLLRSDPLPLPRQDQADHWTIMALEALHRRQPDPAFAARVLDGAARIQELLIGGTDVKLQFRFPDYGCGPAATRGEALASAWRLAQRTDHHAQARDAHGALTAIVQHCLGHQWHPGPGIHETAIGGFRRAPDDPTIRIDIVQHVILAIDGLLEAQRAGAVTPSVVHCFPCPP